MHLPFMLRIRDRRALGARLESFKFVNVDEVSCKAEVSSERRFMCDVLKNYVAGLKVAHTG